jgi:alpha-beta hydrolase superfamily lysophospholipase
MPPDFLAQTLKHASDMIARGEQDVIVPKSLIPPIFTSPITAYRWHSLISVGGDDDFFSSDLSDEIVEGTFGRLDKPTLIMSSGKDEMISESVDKEGLLRRWTRAAKKGVVSELSGVNPGADHELSEVEMQEWFVERVIGFLSTLE